MNGAAVTPKTDLTVIEGMDDTSLDDFLDGAEGETSDGSDAETSEEIKRSEDAEPSQETESDGAEPRATAVEPAARTLQWSPEGGDCEACGTTVDRRWHSEAGLVCAECKEW